MNQPRPASAHARCALLSLTRMLCLGSIRNGSSRTRNSIGCTMPLELENTPPPKILIDDLSWVGRHAVSSEISGTCAQRPR